MLVYFCPDTLFPVPEGLPPLTFPFDIFASLFILRGAISLLPLCPLLPGYALLVVCVILVPRRNLSQYRSPGKDDSFRTVKLCLFSYPEGIY